MSRVECNYSPASSLEVSSDFGCAESCFSEQDPQANREIKSNMFPPGYELPCKGILQGCKMQI